MKSKKTIILHMGMHKTRTSSLQETLFLNRDYLCNHGVVYPACKLPRHTSLVFNAFWNRDEPHWRIFTRVANEKKLQKTNLSKFKNIIIDFANSSNSVIIISSETMEEFSKKSLEHLRNTLENISLDFKIIPVLSVRNHIEYNTSLKQQNIKSTGPNREINLFEFRNKLNVLYSCFPKKDIVIYKFENAKINENGVVGLFFEKIGLDSLVEGLNIIRTKYQASIEC